ncbi:MAG: shikimate kinase, partial [Thermoanaerobaculia bacterium]|nr:shikimate kinase [Thermoanaerobaculia bacterium]
MNVFLSGFMAAGKTTVGRCLAERLEQPFVDLDEAIESVAGESVRRIFERRGEGGFRELESGVLRRVVAVDDVV